MTKREPIEAKISSTVGEDLLTELNHVVKIWEVGVAVVVELGIGGVFDRYVKFSIDNWDYLMPLQTSTDEESMVELLSNCWHREDLVTMLEECCE